jgi:hypothetical protein
MTDNPYLNYPVKNKVRRANSERIVNSANECNRLLERITKLQARLKDVRGCERYDCDNGYGMCDDLEGDYFKRADVIAILEKPE